MVLSTLSSLVYGDERELGQSIVFFDRHITILKTGTYIQAYLVLLYFTDTVVFTNGR